MRLDFLIGFMIEALLILIAAKLVRDLVLRRQGYHVNQMVVQNKSLGAATTQAGYLIGVLLGFLGAINVRGEDPSFVMIAIGVAHAGLVAIALQLLADTISDQLIFRGVRAPAGKVDDVNLSLAVGKAAISIATGLVLRGALSDPEAGLLVRMAWFAAAQAVMILAVLLYCRLTPYDDLAEIKRDNLAAGFPIAGILIAVGLVMEAAIVGRPEASVVQAALATGKFLGVSLVLVYAFRLMTDFIILPKVKLATELVDEKNRGAGLSEGVSFVLAALIVTFFLS